MQGEDLTILVIDENAIRAALIEAGLHELGHLKSTSTVDILGVSRQIAAERPDIIIINWENPNRDTLESLFVLSHSGASPVAMVVDQSDAAPIAAAVEAGVCLYVVSDLPADRLMPLRDLVMARFRAFSRMMHSIARESAVPDPGLFVEPATRLLMKSRGVTAKAAVTLLLNAAIEHDRGIGEIAEGLIISAGLLES